MNVTATKTKKTNQQIQPKEDKFISKIIENLDKVKASDWENYTNVKFSTPKNLFSQNAYQGFNLLSLYIDTVFNQYTSSFYATFNAIAKAGGKLKKGSKGAVIEFFTYLYKHTVTGKNYTREEVQQMTFSEIQLIVKIPCVKTYVVFNSNLIENFEELNLDIESDEPEGFEFENQERCEKFINTVVKDGLLQIEYTKRKTGAYSPQLDKIVMPDKKYFTTENKFYTTLFHEMIHWTGHESRLNRNLNDNFDNRVKYSFEELVAEMGSMLLALQNGIHCELINSIRYLKGWSDKNKENRIEDIKTAFVKSKQAKKFLENL